MSPVEEQLMSILFQIQGYVAKKIEFDSANRRIDIDVEAISQSRCPECLFPHRRYDSSKQSIYIGSILSRAIYANLQVWRVECPVCGVLTEKQGISEGKKRYSKAVGREMVRFTELLDNKAVAKLSGLSPITVYRIDREELAKMLAEYQKHISAPPVVSVDEVSYKKRHNYATVLTNYQDAKVIWLEKDRKAKDLNRAYKVLGKSRHEIKTVAIDFWPAYEKSTRAKLPQARIIYDRFHLSRILNRKVEEERREYQKQLPEDERRELKKDCRWLILKRRSNLNDDNINHLDELKQFNEPLYELYLLKEDFLDIFERGKEVDQARQEILAWIDIVLASNFRKLKAFVRTILRRLETILNWFLTPISNAKAEGVNNVIKTLLKRAYGYKDFDYFRMKVLQTRGYLMNYATHSF